MNVGIDLQEAAQFIDDHGWCQGSIMNARGNVCASGAIAAVTGYDAFRLEAAGTFLRNYIRRHPGARHDPAFFYHTSIAGWNDAKTQDPLIVTSTMRAAAALWLAQNQPSAPTPKDEALPATEAIA